jgi:dipeptide/tripeptide permease
MATETTTPPPITELEEANIVAAPDFAGHPRGLATLFFTELWERFSYYGMRSILILYMTSTAAQGGLGFSVKDAAGIYGTYTMSVYLTAVPGGLIADYLTGARLAVFLGGVIIAAGHFSMVFRSMTTFYLGLILISVGTGLLKPNISTMVGGLYRQNDPRRDSGFSIFYMGINIGSVLAGFIVGYLAKGVTFKNFLASIGQDPNSSWHYGFGAAGVGMVLGLIIYLLTQRHLKERRQQNSQGFQECGQNSDCRTRASDPRRLETDRRNLHLFPVHDPVLGSLRAERRESEPVCGQTRARRDFWNEFPRSVPTVADGNIRDHAGAGVFVSVGSDEGSPAFEPG